MNFEIQELELCGVFLVKSKKFSDTRGHFQEIYKQSVFNELGINIPFIQYNYSLSRQNVVRGLHYQIVPHAQGKLVTVLQGCVWDVVVDVRKSSPSFLKWVAVDLDDSRLSLYIPPGFAHGFATLSKEAIVLYSCTKEYDLKSERGIIFDDPELDINWKVSDPILSDKDAQLPLWQQADLFD